MEEIKTWFISETYFWQAEDGNLKTIEEMATAWKIEDFLKGHTELFFGYRLDGFKRAGINAFMGSYQLKIRLDVYWYGITLTNYNNHEPLVKKLYGEQLTNEDIDLIKDIVHEEIVTAIDRNVENLKK